MHFLRKAALVVATALLPIFLFTLGLIFSLFQVYGTPDRLKSALKESGVYDTFISDVLSNVKAGEGGEADIPVDKPEIQNIIKDAASPEFLQQQTEGFLNGIYAWARGESSELKVEINLVDAKARLVEGLTTYANQHLASLPACTSPPPPGEFDALNATCIPPGTDTAAAVEKVRQDIAGGEFLKDTTITQDDLKNDDGKPLSEQLKEVPKVYDRIVTGLWITAIMALFMAAAIVALGTPWRAGLKRVGITLVAVGGVSSLFALAAGLLASELADNFAQSGEDRLQASITEIVNILTSDLRTWWLGYGIFLVVLGIGTLVALRFIKNGDAEPSPDSETHPKDTPEKPTSSTKPHKPAKPRTV